MTPSGRHTRPACTQGFTRSLKLCQECGFNSCVRVFFIPWGHVSNHAQIWANVTSISHMVQILNSDWSRKFLLRSDWSVLKGAIYTTCSHHSNHYHRVSREFTFSGRTLRRYLYATSEKPWSKQTEKSTQQISSRRMKNHNL